MELSEQTVRANQHFWNFFRVSLSRRRERFRLERMREFQVLTKITLLLKILPSCQPLFKDMRSFTKSCRKRMPCMLKLILPKKTASEQASLKHSLPKWTDGMRKPTHLLCCNRLVFLRTCTKRKWANLMKRLKSRFCWPRHCSETRTFFCLTNRQTVLTLQRSVGLKIFWPIMTRSWLLFLMTVTSWTKSARRCATLISAKSKCMSETMTFGFSQVAWQLKCVLMPMPKKKKKSKSWMISSHAFQQTHQSPSKQLLARSSWKK